PTVPGRPQDALDRSLARARVLHDTQSPAALPPPVHAAQVEDEGFPADRGQIHCHDALPCATTRVRAHDLARAARRVAPARGEASIDNRAGALRLDLLPQPS